MKLVEKFPYKTANRKACWYLPGSLFACGGLLSKSVPFSTLNISIFNQAGIEWRAHRQILHLRGTTKITTKFGLLAVAYHLQKKTETMKKKPENYLQLPFHERSFDFWNRPSFFAFISMAVFLKLHCPSAHAAWAAASEPPFSWWLPKPQI